ncbi:hypothetical protein CR203_03700 [Salipaludibacillus neizhouensis]|uniref:Restriction endonuclease type II-like domain-containing protein n=1 Tax=Salipaludibacillus neizhouensis TaxID=885475 RepID=A0A3A9KXI3_9BACI|nr:DUF559 domain-containing protein [Salipaludibacillus neizhouensis]RKL69146.1 hypothetical protein CR203_03700 [Salipaludibacillus neizhouensis]
METFVLVFTALLVLAVYVTYKEMKTFDRTSLPTFDSEWSKTESPIQRRLLKALRNNGYSPLTEVTVGKRKLRIDIAFPFQKLAIETDGKANHTSPKDKARDRRKDKYLQEHGWRVLRFTGTRIHRDMKGILRRIESELQKES